MTQGRHARRPEAPTTDDRPRPRERRHPRWWPSFLAIWVPLLGWWLAFYPGITTQDSLNAWTQVETGHWTSEHPPPWTALVWLLTRSSSSPALMTFVQTVCVAAAMAATAVVLSERFDAGRWPVVAAVVAAALPWLGPFSVCVWKDVQTLALVLLLGAVLVRGTTPGARRPSPPAQAWLAALGACALGVTLFRWNGVITAGLVVVVVAPAMPRGLRWRSLVAGLAGCLVGSAVLLGLPRVAPIAPIPAVDALAPTLADLAYVSHTDPRALSAADVAVLERVQPLAVWRSTGARCYQVNPVVNPILRANPDGTPSSLEQRASGNASALLGVWRSLAVHHPRDVAAVRLCRASLAWAPLEPAGSAYASLTVVDQHLVTPDEGPLVPWLHDLAVSSLRLTTSLPWRSLFWRPVPWLLLFGVLAAALWRGLGRPLLVVVLAVPVATLVSYAVTAASNDARYTLPAVFWLYLVCAALVGRWWRARLRTVPGPEGGAAARS